MRSYKVKGIDWNFREKAGITNNPYTYLAHITSDFSYYTDSSRLYD